MTKTNAVRILESSGIRFTVRNFEVPDGHMDAEDVAKILGLEPDRVFKTLVSVDESGRHLVFCLPATLALDMKKAAHASGSKRVELIPLVELTPLTGYVRGGCSPIGMKKAFPTFVDETARLFDAVSVSAGLRGAHVELAPDDLLRACGGSYADLT